MEIKNENEENNNGNPKRKMGNGNMEQTTPRQIDFILSDRLTHLHRHKNTNIETEISEFIGSDHYLVNCMFDFDASKPNPFGDVTGLGRQNPNRSSKVFSVIIVVVSPIPDS